jgi:sulfate adenylyltransferase subunit 2
MKYIQIPHFALYSYRRIGYMGCVRNEKQKLYNMAQLTDIVREKYNIEWAFFGFKQSDSMNRRLMLRTYDMNGINEAQKKCYPLSEYRNKDVLEYISRKSLINPESYGGKHQSSGTDITDINYLLFLRYKYPCDLKKVINEYPLVERKLFEYDYERIKTK